jgi:quercetin dioxygenase-like cupin family protein
MENFVDHTILQNITYRSLLEGEKMSSSVTYFKKGSILPMHKHHREQIGYVLKGKLRIKYANEDKIIEPGDSYVLTANVDHEFEALKDSETIDIFAPVKF